MLCASRSKVAVVARRNDVFDIEFPAMCGNVVISSITTKVARVNDIFDIDFLAMCVNAVILSIYILINKRIITFPFLFMYFNLFCQGH